MFENYFMMMTDPADPIRAKGARRVTLAEARKKVTHSPEGTKIYISHGLMDLLSKSQKDCDPDVSVFEAFI